MGQTIVIYNHQTEKGDIFSRFMGGPEFFRAMYKDAFLHRILDIPITEYRSQQYYRPTDFKQVRTWAEEYIPTFKHETHPLHKLLTMLEENEHLWICEVW